MFSIIESSIWYFLMGAMNILLFIALFEVLKDRSKNAFKGIFIVLFLISFLVGYAYIRDFKTILGQSGYSLIFGKPSTIEIAIPLDAKLVQEKINVLENSLVLLAKQTQKINQNKLDIEKGLRSLNFDDVDKLKESPIGSALYRQYKLNGAELLQNQGQFAKISKSLDGLKRLQRQLQNKEIIQMADLKEEEALGVLKSDLSLADDKPLPLLDLHVDKEIEAILAISKSK